MCSYSWQIRMDNKQGDLGDIVRATGCGAASTASHRVFDAGTWQLPPELASFPPMAEGSNDDFGDPFSSFKDPLLHEQAGATLFDSPDSAAGFVEMIATGNDGGGAMAGAGGSGGSLMSQKIVMGDEMKRPCSIFSKASSMVSPREIRPSVFTGDMVKVNISLAADCPLDEEGLQISSTRIPSIKRRKGQAKKVVCIPAPEAASGRPGGEVVPSDLWAWRKYGQKPIKGSPYPRGYYRCSSSKGCSARKQVERSRADPNMLVITYTSEHNHPWPTQRNALAGSTRSSQPAAKNSPSAPKSSPHNQRSLTSKKEESRETVTMATMASPPDVKEEAPEMEKPADINIGEHELDQLFHRSYEPVPLGPANPSVDDLFAGLGELGGDPMSLVFSKQFMGDKTGGGREDKAVDPFSIFDWGGNSLGETRKGGL